MSDESMAPVEDRPIEPAADEALLEYMLDEPAALYIRASTAKWVLVLLPMAPIVVFK
jgi:hypothetical protein